MGCLEIVSSSNPALSFRYHFVFLGPKFRLAETWVTVIWRDLQKQKMSTPSHPPPKVFEESVFFQVKSCL